MAIWAEVEGMRERRAVAAMTALPKMERTFIVGLFRKSERGGSGDGY
jgi:hypothetical protein